MKLEEIKIKGFRSIESCTIKTDNLTALVGENNSGKSSILKALNCSFNYDEEKVFILNDTHKYTKNTHVNIILTFTNIPSKDIYNGKVENNRLTLRLKVAKSSPIYSYKKNNKFTNVDNVFIDNLKKDINYVLIPINRDYREIVWADNTLLKTLLNQYFQKVTAKRDTITPKVKEVASSIEKQMLSKIQKSLDEFYPLHKEFKFNLKYNKLIDYNFLLDDIFLELEENNLSYGISESGSGVQSLTTISIYRYMAQINNTNIILGVEEPEVNLHPQAQREFINSISNDKSDAQILFTTHSSVIIDQLSHDKIVLFRKINDSKRGFKTSVDQVPQNFWKINNIEEYKYNQFYSYKNSEFFFSKYIIITESKNDAEVVRNLLLKENIDVNVYGVSIIELGGVLNIKYPLSLLEHLKIPFFIIVDKDYFIPYLNDALKDSRNSSGFPKYRYEYKENNKNIIAKLIPNDKDREDLLKLFKANHSKAMDLLVKHNIISMTYNLEIDLIASNTAANLFYSEILKRNPDDSKVVATAHLLVENANKIKKIENIIFILDKLPKKNLPNSYKRISKTLPLKIKEQYNPFKRQ